jgi:hypothetical protein
MLKAAFSIGSRRSESVGPSAGAVVLVVFQSMSSSKRGRLLFKPGSVVEYITPEKWSIEATIGYDETRKVEVIDLRTLDQWRPGDDPLGLAHAPDERRDISEADFVDIEEAFTANFTARRRPLLVIRHDGTEFTAELPPGPVLVEPAGPAGVQPRPKPRRPRLGYLAEPINRRTAPLIVGPFLLFFLAFGIARFSRPAALWLGGTALLSGAVIFLLSWRVTSRIRRRKRKNLCVECGYSRRGTPEDVACPECGAGHWYS